MTRQENKRLTKRWEDIREADDKRWQDGETH